MSNRPVQCLNILTFDHFFCWCQIKLHHSDLGAIFWQRLTCYSISRASARWSAYARFWMFEPHKAYVITQFSYKKLSDKPNWVKIAPPPLTRSDVNFKAQTRVNRQLNHLHYIYRDKEKELKPYNYFCLMSGFCIGGRGGRRDVTQKPIFRTNIFANFAVSLITKLAVSPVYSES